MYTIIYIKQHTGILTLNCDIHIYYYIQIESLIFARKSVPEKEKKDKTIFIDRSYVMTKKDDVGRVPLVVRAIVFLRDGIACSFVVTMNEHYRNLETTLIGRSLRPNFVLDASKKLVLRVSRRGLCNENIIAQKYFIILE